LAAAAGAQNEVKLGSNQVTGVLPGTKGGLGPVTLSGTPAAGKVPTGTDATHAIWQTPAAGSSSTGSAGALQSADGAGGFQGNAAVIFQRLTALATPSSPTVTRLGSAGAETCSYKVVAHNLVGFGVPSAAGSVTDCQLSGISNSIVTAAVTGSTYCDVFLTAAPAGGQTGLLTTPLTGVACGSTYSDTTGIAANTNPPSALPDSTVGLAVEGTLTASETLRSLQKLQVGSELISDTFCTNSGFISPLAPSQCAPVSFALTASAAAADGDWTLGQWIWTTFPAETHGIEVGFYTNAYHPNHGVSESYDALFGGQISASARNSGTVDDLRGFQAYAFAYNPALTINTIYGNTGFAEMDGGTAHSIIGAQGQAMAFNDAVTTVVEGGHFEAWQLTGTTIAGKVIGVTAQITYDVGSSAAYELYLPSFASSNAYSAQWAIRQEGTDNPNLLAGPVEQGAQIFAAVSLLTIPDGTSIYCSDCTVTSGVDNTCAGSGSGAMVNKLNGVLRCRI